MSTSNSWVSPIDITHFGISWPYSWITMGLGFPDSSVSKESACSAGDPGSIPGSGRFPWRRDRLPISVFLGFPCGSAGKESTCNARDLGLIPGLGRSPGKGNGYPLQYSSLEKSRDCIVHGVTKSQHDWATFTFFPNSVCIICLFLSFSIILLWAKLLSLS